MKTNFETIKQEIISRGLHLPCDITNMSDLMEIFLEEYSDTSNDPEWNTMIPAVLSAEFIRCYRDDFASCGVYANENAKDSVLVVCNQGEVIVSGDNSIVVAYGSAHVKADSVGTIIATDDVFVDATNCQVEAYGRAMVVGHGKTSIELRDEASAEGFDSTYIFAYSKGKVVLHDEAEAEQALEKAICKLSPNECKPRNKRMCLRDKTKACDLCHECDIDISQPRY